MSNIPRASALRGARAVSEVAMRHVGDGPGLQGSRFASDTGAPGVAKGALARGHRGPGSGQHPQARAPSSDLAQGRH
eukprot:474523-Alexandrium_andersonii.AAC.1